MTAKTTFGNFLERASAKSTGVGTDDCWLWEGANNRGYGTISFQGEMWYIHRLAYYILVDEIPDGLDVCHKCDVTNCWNPDHLFPGTAHDNMVDMWSKGRGEARNPFGESAHNVKLTAENVREILALREKGFELQTIADLFNVGKSQVHRIVSGKSRTTEL